MSKTLRPDVTVVEMWHNIVWSRYKGEVFSAVYEISSGSGLHIRFFQIAETERGREDLSAVYPEFHRYPYQLLYRGMYGDVSLLKRAAKIGWMSFQTDAEIIIIAGFEKFEYWLQLFILKLRSKQVMVFCDSTIFDRKQRRIVGVLKRIFFRSVDGILCYGQRSREYVIHYGADPKMAFPNCQAAALLQNYDSEAALASRKRWAPCPEAPRYLYVGRLSIEKGLDTLLMAFAKVSETNKRAILVIVGSGAQREELQEQARGLQLGASVQFSGSKSGADLFHEYSKASCLVLPSRSEPWGLVVNEALAHGCPVVVSSNCGCVPELVLEGKTGFSHIPRDENDLAEKMILAPVHFRNIEMTAAACLNLIANHTPRIAAEHILSGIRTVLSKSRDFRS